MKAEMGAALEQDLGVSAFAGEMAHIEGVLWDVDYSQKNVAKVCYYPTNLLLVHERRCERH